MQRSGVYRAAVPDGLWPVYVVLDAEGNVVAQEVIRHPDEEDDVLDRLAGIAAEAQRATLELVRDGPLPDQPRLCFRRFRAASARRASSNRAS